VCDLNNLVVVLQGKAKKDHMGQLAQA